MQPRREACLTPECVNLTYYVEEGFLSEVFCVFPIPDYSPTPREDAPVVLGVNGSDVNHWFPSAAFVVPSPRAFDIQDALRNRFAHDTPIA